MNHESKLFVGRIIRLAVNHSVSRREDEHPVLCLPPQLPGRNANPPSIESIRIPSRHAHADDIPLPIFAALARRNNVCQPIPVRRS